MLLATRYALCVTNQSSTILIWQATANSCINCLGRHPTGFEALNPSSLLATSRRLPGVFFLGSINQLLSAEAASSLTEAVLFHNGAQVRDDYLFVREAGLKPAGGRFRTSLGLAYALAIASAHVSVFRRFSELELAPTDCGLSELELAPTDCGRD